MLKNYTLSVFVMLISFQFAFAGGPPNAIPGEYILQMRSDLTYNEVETLLEEKYGAIIMNGPLIYKNTYLVYQDSALTYPPSDLPNLGDDIENAQVHTQVDTWWEEYVSSGDFNYELEENTNTKFIQTWNNDPPPNNACHDNFYQIEIGDNQVKARVFDTGILPMHHEIYGHYNYNEEESSTWGYNYIDGEGFSPKDQHGHGTAMTSIILINYDETNAYMNLDIETDQTHNKMGEGDLWSMMLALDSAIEDEVNVINMSYTFAASYEYRDYEDTPLYQLLDVVRDEGILCVVAAGNDYTNIDHPEFDSYYPAAYPHDNILSVAGMYCNKKKLVYSNYGHESIDIFANGKRVKALNFLGEEIVVEGTSAAAALVSALALQLGSHQEVFDYQNVKCAIMNGASQHNNLAPYCQSGGYINAENALSILEGACDQNQGRVGIIEDTAVLHNYDGNRFQLDLQTNSPQNVSVTVYNMMGQEVANAPAALFDGAVSISLNIPEEGTQAVYFARIFLDNRMKTIKFFKHDLR